MAKIQRRPLRLSRLQDSVGEVQFLADRGYQRAGNWSLTQICQHLNKTMTMSMNGADFKIPSFFKPVARWLLWQRIVDGRATRLPLITPPPLRPNDSTDSQQELDRYADQVERIQSTQTQLIPEHPVFGRVTKEQWLQFHAWHAAHHLSYLIPHEATAVVEPTA